MSIIDDYAAIGKALRDITEPPANKLDFDELTQVAVPTPQQAPWAQGPQAHSHQYQQARQQALSCILCGDEGWIGVLRSGRWLGIQCIRCGNPTRRRNPLP